MCAQSIVVLALLIQTKSGHVFRGKKKIVSIVNRLIEEQNIKQLFDHEYG